MSLEGLSQHIGERLKARGYLLATAESCTGGWVAQVVTATAGSSAWFDRGFVTYSNQAKQDMLGVSADTLACHGAVSENVAREMAAGALRRSQAQAALAITGIAGPAGGTPDKPVGTVCLAWALTDGKVASCTCHFTGNRETIRRQAVVEALQGLIRIL
jgi:nicotinamide-nucleotide amidase